MQITLTKIKYVRIVVKKMTDTVYPSGSGSVSVIDGLKNAVIATIPGGS